MTEWIDWLRQYAFEAGAGGLFALGVVDSAGLPTGGGPDVVLALLASLRPERAYVVGLVAAATLSSVVGCLALYTIGRRGVDDGARHFGAAAIRRTRAALQRHGAWLLFLSMLAPPPVPAKLFVLCAGLAAVPRLPFVVATLAGRALRYGLVAGLAVRYGPRVLERIGPSSTAVLGLLLIAALVALTVIVGRRRRARRTEDEPVSTTTTASADLSQHR